MLQNGEKSSKQRSGPSPFNETLCTLHPLVRPLSSLLLSPPYLLSPFPSPLNSSLLLLLTPTPTHTPHHTRLSLRLSAVSPLVSGAGFVLRASGFGFRALGLGIQVSGLRFQVSCCEFRVPLVLNRGALCFDRLLNDGQFEYSKRNPTT